MKRLICPVDSIERFNNDTRRILLETPEPVDFFAGQYLQLVLPEKKFPFSIASSPLNKQLLELHIRPTPGSDDSDLIESALDNAQYLDIEIPLGDCYIESAPDNPIIMIAASTGITQMKSIFEFLVATGSTQQVYLYWGVLTDADLYLADLCHKWQVQYDNFHYVPVVSEPDTAPNWSGRTGLVGEEALQDFDDVSNVTVIVSGGPGMVYATLDAFMARGMPEANMKSDIFSYAPRN